MTLGDLDGQAQEFAALLTDLVRGTIGGATTFEVIDNGPFRKIGPAPFESNRDRRRRAAGSSGLRASHDPTGFATIPLTRACDQTADGGVHDRLRLKVEYNCRLDDFGEHLAVHDSVFGLWVQADPTRKPTPVVRVEYLRTPVTPGHPPAHVHLHAESAELGWVYGTAGLAMPRLEEIHFPVGGRRFRPTIEEFLLVLDREGIFRDWGAVDWRDTVHRSLEVWEDLQVRATVRSQPGPASDQLRRMGYRVVPPPPPGEA